GIGGGGLEGAGLAIGRDGNGAADAGGVAFFAHEAEFVVVHHGVGAGVGAGFAGERVVLAVELAGPLGVLRISVRVDAIGGALDVVAGHLVGDGGVLYGVGGDFAFSFIHLPGAHVR